MKLLDVLEGTFEGFSDRVRVPFDAVCRGTTIRIHVGPYGHQVSDNNSFYFQFPGYPASTEVEVLKFTGGAMAWAMQVCEGGRRSGDRLMANNFTDSSQLIIIGLHPVR